VRARRLLGSNRALVRTNIHALPIGTVKGVDAVLVKGFRNFFPMGGNRTPNPSGYGSPLHRQGLLLGKMRALGYPLQKEATLAALTEETVKSSAIEGAMLNPESVRSSLARRMGLKAAGTPPADRNVEGIVEMMLDATQKYATPLTDERLFGWHGALLPSGRSGIHKGVALSHLAQARAMSGNRAEARKILLALQEPSEPKFVSAWDFAQIHIALGDKSKALDFLEKAADQHFGWVVILAVDPTFDPLRAEPRFKALQRRVRIPV
jgi:hypothetical protein